MPRLVKESTLRRNQILDVAQRLVYTKGYEQMTIQDILTALQISKGAFYYYFSSKQALLEALVERLADEAEKFILPILKDPQATSIEKLEHFFVTTGRWKTDQKAYLLSLMKVWYADENAIVREKMLIATARRFAPLLAEVICQGVEEGVLNTPYPQAIAEALIYMIKSLGDIFMEPLLNGSNQEGAYHRVENAVAAYSDALERMLGAPSGSLHLMDAATLAEWIPPP